MKQTIKILIVEDEALIAESIRLTLVKLGYQIAGIASNALDAIEILNTQRVDLAILDINIQGDKNGIWLAKTMFKNKPFIFLTAYGDDATIKEASLTNPSSYLLKPFRKEDISAAIQVAVVNYSENKTATIDFKNKTAKNKEILKQQTTFFIKQKDAYIKLLIKDILFIKSDKNYLTIQSNQQNFLIRNTIKEILEILPDNFVQTHRSFIINTNKMDKVSAINIKINNYIIPISNSYKKELLSHIHKLI